MLRIATRRPFGVFGALNNAIKTPLKHFNKFFEGSRGDNSPIGNLGEKFDDEAAEWQAVIVEGAYELNTFQNWDNIIQGNFGTLDNPHLIFTSDIPYRFVGCTGAPGEDDFEGHEIMYFMLREGPLQRCMSCGQVFKLVRLRDEQSTENEYYRRDFVPQDIQEMGEADHWIMLNAVRFMMFNSYEHTHFEVATDPVFSLKNSDDHDRLLVDPAYRLEQIKIGEHKMNVMNKVEENLAQSAYKIYGRNPVPFTKDTYENLVHAEIAANRLNRHFKAVQRFNMRSVLDPINHARREQRMKERATQRIKESHTFYLNGMTEGELQFRDYYESDEEALNMLSQNLKAEKELALSNNDFEIKNFKFMEQYSDTNDKDASGYISKKVFRFNYRQAYYSREDHQRKENRMLQRLRDSNFARSINDAVAGSAAKALKEPLAKSNKLEFYELVVKQALENYKNYFESDLEEDFGFVQGLPLSELKEFAGTFDENGLLGEEEKVVAAVSIPKETDQAEGIFGSFMSLENSFNKEVGGLVDNLTVQNRNPQLVEDAFKKAREEKKALEK